MKTWMFKEWTTKYFVRKLAKTHLRGNAEFEEAVDIQVRRILFWYRVRQFLHSLRFIRVFIYYKPAPEAPKTLAQKFAEKEVDPQTSSWKDIINFNEKRK
jgi:hypothetical protein